MDPVGIVSFRVSRKMRMRKVRQSDSFPETRTGNPEFMLMCSGRKNQDEKKSHFISSIFVVFVSLVGAWAFFCMKTLKIGQFL